MYALNNDEHTSERCSCIQLAGFAAFISTHPERGWAQGERRLVQGESTRGGGQPRFSTGVKIIDLWSPRKIRVKTDVNEGSKLPKHEICPRTHILQIRNQITSERVQDEVENLLVLLMNKPPSALPLRSS
jgi:hypothetical protein